MFGKKIKNIPKLNLFFWCKKAINRKKYLKNNCILWRRQAGMASRKEKLVMTYLCKVCSGKKTQLVSPNEIAEALSNKAVLSIAEIDEFVVSDSKNGYYYCVNLKKKGISYIADSKKSRKALGLLVLRSIFLATVSFVFGVILKAIFRG